MLKRNGKKANVFDVAYSSTLNHLTVRRGVVFFR